MSGFPRTLALMPSITTTNRTVTSKMNSLAPERKMKTLSKANTTHRRD